MGSIPVKYRVTGVASVITDRNSLKIKNNLLVTHASDLDLRDVTTLSCVTLLPY